MPLSGVSMETVLLAGDARSYLDASLVGARSLNAMQYGVM
jgi:hypothetical protein